tara:strand:- start:7490 stop:7594 length:105 start_codon:yes stop_codon:yes gene_type:complete
MEVIFLVVWLIDEQFDVEHIMVIEELPDNYGVAL